MNGWVSRIVLRLCIRSDLRYGLRTLRKSPGVSAVIVLSLAIGIGANTAIFSVVNGLLLKPLPYPDPDRLAALWLRSPGIGIPQDWPSPGQYIDIQRQNRSFEETSISRGGSFNMTGLRQVERIDGLRTSSSLFHLLGARPLHGRLLLPEEDQPGKPPVAVLSHGLWQRLFGTVPAFRAARGDLNSALKTGGRTTQTAGIGHNRLRGLLAAGELALTLMLLIGAGLLIRSFGRLQEVPPGFNANGVLTIRLAPAGPKYRDRTGIYHFYREAGERFSHLPGVQSQGAITALPFTSAVGWGGIRIEGYTPPPDQPELQVDYRSATTEYFRAMQIPLRSGRFFSEHDTADGPRVTIIDEKMANRFWPRGDAVGKRVQTGGPQTPWTTIVGVVGTVKQYGLDVDGRMVFYGPHQQMPAGNMYVVARTSGQDPARLASAIIREVHAIDPDVPAFDIRTMDERVHESLARQRFSMTMLTAFAGFALILAAVGVYGVISYLVTQGTHDIGVRIALGASRRRILEMVVRQGIRIAGAGIVAGLTGAVALTRVMASLLFGVSTRDVATFSVVTLFLAGVALLATYVPALRATQVDPMAALRDE